MKWSELITNRCVIAVFLYLISLNETEILFLFLSMVAYSIQCFDAID